MESLRARGGGEEALSDMNVAGVCGNYRNNRGYIWGIILCGTDV